MKEIRPVYKKQSVFQKERNLLKILPYGLRVKIEVIPNYEIIEFVKFAAKELKPGRKILDAGAGECPYKNFFSHLQYVSADFCQVDNDYDQKDIDLVCDLTSIPVQNESFEAVLCTQVLEHVKDPQAVIKEFYRVLKPKGKLFLSAPQGWEQHQKPYDFFRFTSFALAHLFKTAGFKVIYIKPMGGYFRYLSARIQKIIFYLFPPTRHLFFEIIRYPFKLIVGGFFCLLIPIIFFYLDKIDREKDQTLGYTCYCLKE